MNKNNLIVMRVIFGEGGGEWGIFGKRGGEKILLSLFELKFG